MARSNNGDQLNHRRKQLCCNDVRVMKPKCLISQLQWINALAIAFIGFLVISTSAATAELNNEVCKI